MRRHVEFHAVRTVAIRRPGGNDWPHRTFVSELSKDEFEFEGCGVWLSDIMGLSLLTWNRVGSCLDRW